MYDVSYVLLYVQYNTISYALEAVYLKMSYVWKLNKVQSKLTKCMLGNGERYKRASFVTGSVFK